MERQRNEQATRWPWSFIPRSASWSPVHRVIADWREKKWPEAFDFRPVQRSVVAENETFYLYRAALMPSDYQASPSLRAAATSLQEKNGRKLATSGLSREVLSQRIKSFVV